MERELTVQAAISVRLNTVSVTSFVFVPGSDAAHPDRGLPHNERHSRFVGLQTHTGRVAFRRIQIKAL